MNTNVKGYRKDGTPCIYVRRGDVLYHRILAELYLPKPDGKYEVHHLDIDSTNNDLANLVCLTPAEHRRLHHALRMYNKLVAQGDCCDIWDAIGTDMTPDEFSRFWIRYNVLDREVYRHEN